MSRQCGAIDRDKHNVILEAAIDVAGGARPSLAAVASRARVSRQTVYNQFGGAQGVRRAVLNWCEAALREPFETFPAQSETRAEGVRRFIRLLLRQNEVQVVRGLLDVPGMRASAPMIVQL
ncbi:MAG: TetR/AcrR family transcriptional regulator [Brevundimonas sp.]|uniref:TetR/AcrR family transcriptional regulator n=1 Tax=Brevundimonas sp. TaxID=1871086 RepID=UPI00391D2AC3